MIKLSKNTSTAASCTVNCWTYLLTIQTKSDYCKRDRWGFFILPTRGTQDGLQARMLAPDVFCNLLVQTNDTIKLKKKQRQSSRVSITWYIASNGLSEYLSLHILLFKLN